jgi:sugar phosphate isomerase/epimerase
MTHILSSISRRTFFAYASAVTGAAVMGALPAMANGNAPPRFKRGLQLYTVRDPMSKDAEGTLLRIAQLGYEDLETYGFDRERVGYYGFGARRFKQILDARGLTSTSGHYDLFRYLNEPLPALQGYVDKCIEGALALDQRYITWPWLDPQSRTLEHFKQLAERLNVIGEQIHKAGLGLAYHNHDFEFIDHGGERVTTF